MSEAVVVGMQTVIVGRITIESVARQSGVAKPVVKDIHRGLAIPQDLAQAVFDAVHALYKEAGFAAPGDHFHVASAADHAGRKASPAVAYILKKEKALQADAAA